MKKLICALYIAVFFCTGCSSTGLVHDKSYLRAVYAETNGGETHLSMAFFSDEETVSVSGEDIYSAVKSAEIQKGKPIVTGFTELVILGDGGEKEILEYMLNKWKVSPSCLAVKNTDGAEKIENCDIEKLIGTIRESVKQKKFPPCDIVTVLGDYLIGKK